MRWLLVLVVGLLANSAYAEPNDAEKLFRDMEKKIASSKTLECDFEAKVAGTGKKASIKASLTLGEGNKFHFESNGEADGSVFKDGGVFKLVVISDGKKSQVALNGEVQGKHDNPKHGGEVIRASITRAGAFTPFFLVAAGPVDEEFKIDEQFAVSDFKLGKKEKIGDREAQEIQYLLTPKGLKESMSVNVWIDTKTILPLKRVITVPLGGDTLTFTETCSKLTLDPKVDAKKFEFPKE
jgi:outer membrane lipoprotein-sorting protein